MAKLG